MNQSLLSFTLLLIMMIKPIPQILALLLNHLQSIYLSTIFFYLLLIKSKYTVIRAFSIFPTRPLLGHFSLQGALISSWVILWQLLLHNGFSPQIGKLVVGCIAILNFVVDDIAHAKFQLFFARNGGVGVDRHLVFGRNRCELEAVLPPPLIDFGARERFVEVFGRRSWNVGGIVVVMVVIVEMFDRIGALVFHSYIIIQLAMIVFDALVLLQNYIIRLPRFSNRVKLCDIVKKIG